MSDFSVEFKNLSVGYNSRPLHEPFSFSVGAGEFVSLIGANGSGKSTIIKTLIKEIPAVSGDVFIYSKNLRDFNEKELSCLMSALLTVSVKSELLTCRDVVAGGRYPHTGHFGLLTKEDNEKIDEALCLVKADDFAQKDFMKVSDGQKQRILFARALCQNPKILVLDEPTSYLDIRWRLEMISILKDLCEKGVTVIASLHEIDLALKASDRILCVGEREVKELSRNEAECRAQIRELYKLEEDFFEKEKSYAELVKVFCEKGEVSPYASSKESATPSAGEPATPTSCSTGKSQIFPRLAQNTPREFCQLRRRSLSHTASPQAVVDTTPSSRGDLLKAPEASLPATGESSARKHCAIMVQGTMSNAGKSFIVAGLCRIFKQDGFSVAPFKSQNMALNSFVTNEGLEMGRAQVMQAEAAGVEPSVLMNPILLKPTSDVGSQVIVNGEAIGNMGAKDYFAFKKSLVPHIKSAYEKLASSHDVIVMEGAGSPAEINLKENDIVNMGMAEIADSPVLIVADIDRGGVFAQLVGTVDLLEPNERSRVKGLIINKFRGDKSILDSGIKMLEEKTGIPVVGTVPYMKIQLDDEDSLSENMHTVTKFRSKKDEIQLAIVRLPHISNFTDFIPLQNLTSVNSYYVQKPEDFGKPDCVILPGTKNTLADLQWLKNSGLADFIQKEAENGTPVVGICGGFQMLGEKLVGSEELGVGSGKFENPGMEKSISCGDSSSLSEKNTAGLSLLPVVTEFCPQKALTRVKGKVIQIGNGVGEQISERVCCEGNVENGTAHAARNNRESLFSSLSGVSVSGYEIHQGRTCFVGGAEESFFSEITDGVTGETKLDGAVKGNVFGTYIHGLFDEADFTSRFVKILAKRKGFGLNEACEMPAAAEIAENSLESGDFSKSQIFNGKAQNGGQGKKFASLREFKESQYNLLAETLRQHLDMKKIYEIMGL